MNSRICNRLIALALFALAAETGAAEPVQILLPGTWHGDEVSAEACSDWWGVFPEGNGFTLQPAPVTITRVEDGIIDNPGEMTGKKVTIPQETAPVILLHGLPNPVAGPLHHLDGPTLPAFIYPGQSVYLAMGGVEQPAYFRLAALGVAEDRADFPAVQIRDYRVRLYQSSGPDTKTQTLAAIPEIIGDGQPLLVWAGDLDRDGKIDLLYNLTNHYNVSHLALYLSSAAEGDDFVGLVAEWITTGC